jgi:drug/metabolite transporter (DMT)-like permease
VILWPGAATAGSLTPGHVYALISSVLCAITLLLVRRLGRQNNIYTLFYYLCLAGGLASLGPLLVQGTSVVPQQPVAWLQLAAVAVFSVGAQLSINQALIRIPAPKVSVMMTAEVPLASCFGILYLGEPLSWRLLVGALLIIGSGVALSMLPAKRGPARMNTGIAHVDCSVPDIS